MKRKLPLYCIAAFLALIAGGRIWGADGDGNSKKSESNSGPGDAPSGSVEGRSQEEPKADSAASGSNGISNHERNGTPTKQIKLLPVNGAPFVARRNPPPPDHKHWNKAKDLYLLESSVWYELYDREGRKIFRFPNHINVDASGRPGAHDRARGDIKWQWADDLSVVGVQQIIQRELDVATKGQDGEFSEFPPDSARIYLYDVKKTDMVYELVPPNIPKGLVVRLEGVSEDGHLSLAALSPEAYNRGNELKNDPKHYQSLGEYQFDLGK